MIRNMFKLTKLQKTLCSIIRNDLSDIQVDENLYTLASSSDLSALVGHSLLSKIRSCNELEKKCIEAHSVVEKQMGIFFKELDRIASEMNDEGISIVALKNGGIARGIFKCSGCCPMGDLDLLVKRSQFRIAHEIMIKNGYMFKYRSELEKEDIETAEKNGGAEYWKIVEDTNKIWIELQWRPVAGRWLRRDREPDGQKFIERAVSLKNTPVKILSPVDNLLQVCLHTAKHTYVRAPGFRLHLDVHRIVNACSIEWEEFCKTVEEKHVKTVVYLSLLIPFNLLHTPIPKAVIRRLAPPSWKKNVLIWWISRAGFFDNGKKKFGKLGFYIFNTLLCDSFIDVIQTIVPPVSYFAEEKDKSPLAILYLKYAGNLLFRKLKI